MRDPSRDQNRSVLPSWLDRGPVRQVEVQVISVPDGEADYLTVLKQGLHLGKGHGGYAHGAVEKVVRAQQQQDRREVQPHPGALGMIGQTASLLLW